MNRHAFRAMGTEIEFHLDSGPADETLRAAEQEFRRLERLLSRFLPDSQLSRLNAEGRIVAGPDLFAVVEAALEARERTAGRFDPTVHEAVVAAGYDRTFELVSSGTCASLPADVECGGAVALDRTTCSIMLAPGVKLDLGGIAKGYAVDRALGMLAGAGAAVVDAGGDIGVSGKPWPIGVETGEGTITLEVRDGALATSGRDRRRWPAPEGERHHLIDPATGWPAGGDLLRVTVLAATAMEAEVLAKSLFLASDSKRAAAEADARGTPAVLVTRDGRTVTTGGLA